MMHGIGQRPGGGRGEQGAAPVQRMVDAVGFRAAQALDEGKTQGQRQGGIQSEHDQGLAQAFAFSALGVERRVGDAQHLGRQGGVQAQRPGDLGELDFRIAGEFDDVRRHTGRGWKIDE
jgi:hypothetical protein